MQKATFAITIPHFISHLHLRFLQRPNHTSITPRSNVHGTLQINQSNFLVSNNTDWVENIKFFSELGERIKRNNKTSNLLELNMFSLMFYPGTELYEKAIEDKIIDENYVEKTLLTMHYQNHPFNIHNFLMFFYYLCLKNRFKIILKFIKEPIFIKHVNKLSLIRHSVLLEKPLWLLTVALKRLI